MTTNALAPSLAQALCLNDAALTLRIEQADDFSFIAELYADVRHEELAPLPWPGQAKRDFLDAQCRLQRNHYAEHYRGAELLVIERAGTPIGRAYVHATASEIRLMDIALLRAERNHGIGSAIVRRLQEESRNRTARLTLHVEPDNPAQRLYRRLGFVLIEHRGVYDFLGWSPAGTGEGGRIS